MVFVGEVHDLVGYDVFDDRGWGLEDAPVEADGLSGAAAPAFGLLGDDDVGDLEVG